MGNKTTLNSNNKSNHPLFPTTPHVFMGGIQKIVHEAKQASRVGRKAREIVRNNLAFFTKSINPLIKHNSTNIFLLSSSSTSPSNSRKLPSNDQEDAPSHQSLYELLAQEYALHASPSWQYVDSTMGEPRFPHVDVLPRTWKECLKPGQQELYGFSAKQVKYQELIYEIILTEQSYVDDLILVYKIFINETLVWDGLPSAVKHLFENIFQIIRLHLQLLKELREYQMEQHPVIRSITDIFRSFISRFEVYAAYFSNFEKANNIITESIKTQDELGSFIYRRSLWAECRNLPLSAYLLTPIQRVMKYPLFFKSLAECLSPKDGDLANIHKFLQEMDVILRYFERQKKESEDFIKLEDLACRIKGLEGSTIHIAEHGRRLIYEGYLTIVPESDQNFSCARLDKSSASFSSSLYPSTLSRKNSTFSKKQKRTYVFLFNDMIVCTTERDKRRPSATKNRAMGPPPRKGTYYGPSPDTLFKITHTPGKITLVDRAVTSEIVYNNSDKPSRRGSTLFQSLRRYGSRVNDEGDNNFVSSPSSKILQSPYFTSQSCNDMLYYHNKSQVTLERHPLQFICSIATRNLINLHFEAETPEEKDIWCQKMESVLSEHVQRNDTHQTQPQQLNEKDNNHHVRVSLSPTHSTYSIESISSSESVVFSSSWTGYCDVERMDIDDLDQPYSVEGPSSTKEDLNLMNGDGAAPLNKSQDILQTIMSEFGDSIWQMGVPTVMSPYQLRQTFSNKLGS